MVENDYDALILDAANLLIEHKKASISLLQRNLKVGNNRAVRIIHELNQLGVVDAIIGAHGYILNVFEKFETEDELFNYIKSR